MPLKPPPSSAPARARVIVALVGAVTLAGFLRFTADDVLTHAQLDRGIFVGSDRDSPAQTLAHPWSGSGASGRAALKAPAEPGGELVLRAFLAPLEQGGATDEIAEGAGAGPAEADDASPQAPAEEAASPTPALPAAV
ncbi:MAG TPA: hypothetical protein VNN10_09760, partial [Dehalococcoidia bacterium]|nr:hypothetical protein [Dehalococcoidia bacterium]